MAVTRSVEYDNAGDCGREYGVLRLRCFDDGQVELVAKPGDACETHEAELWADGLDIVLNLEQVRHLRDLLNEQLERVGADDEPMIRELA